MSELSGNSGQLKPCPFCGEPAAGGEWPYIPQSDSKQHGMVAVAQCPNRDCPVQPDITLFTEGLTPEDTGTWADVKTQWNTRPIEDELLEKLQQLRAQWESVPWEDLWIALECSMVEEYLCHPHDGKHVAIAKTWFAANAPSERLTDEQLEALVELIRKA